MWQQLLPWLTFRPSWCCSNSRAGRPGHSSHITSYAHRHHRGAQTRRAGPSVTHAAEFPVPARSPPPSLPQIGTSADTAKHALFCLFFRRNFMCLYFRHLQLLHFFPFKPGNPRGPGVISFGTLNVLYQAFRAYPHQIRNSKLVWPIKKTQRKKKHLEKKSGGFCC